MNKRDFFIYSIQNDLYLNRGWGEMVFSIMVENSPSHHLQLHGVSYKDKRFYGLVNGKEELIEDYKLGYPLYIPQEHVNLPAHSFKCIKKDILTSYGIAIMNAYYIERPYEGKVDFLNEFLTANKLNNLAKDLFVSGKVTIEEHKRFENAPGFTTALAECSVSSFSEKAVTSSPDVLKLKKELLIKHKHELDDPVVVANIQNKLEQLDKEYLKGDSAEYFFSLAKPRMSRNRLKTFYGGEQDFFDTTKTVVMENSLEEGIQLKDMVLMNNSIRSGSHSRAVNTALGGAKVKETGRFLQNFSITANECNTKIGRMVYINKDNYDQYIGRHLLGKENSLTEEELKQYIGKYITIRSPMYCRPPNKTNVCPKCMGDKVVMTKIGIAALGNTFTSTLMSIEMSAMHSAGLSVTKYNYLDRIS